LTTADSIVTYKAIVRALAAKIGYSATFMPKPFGGENGNGMHFHLSLFQGENNLFSTDKRSEISLLGQHFMAGILEHAEALTVLVAPTVNSFKRLVPGFEAPVYVAWAARFEYRCPDPSANPYLALIAIIAAGMDGVDRELELPPPVKSNIFALSSEERTKLDIKELPGNLFQALGFLERDDVIKNALGEHIFEHFLKLKKAEWLQYSTQVSDWDLKRYYDV
jgi:glutamine synthetase